MTQLTQQPTAEDIQQLPTPPGPRGHWLLGNYPDLEADALGFLTGLRRQYGDVVRTRFLVWNAYFVAHPDGVQHVLQSNHRNYNKEFIEYEKLSWIVGNGLLTSDGDFWLRQRRLAAPAFHRKNIAGYATIMTAAADDMLQGWETAAAQQQPLDISKEMMRATLRIVTQALFSFDSAADAATVDHAFSFANEYIGTDAERPFAQWLRHIPTARNRRFKESIDALDAIVYRIINTRRQQPETAADNDLLAMLMNARDEETGAGMTDQQLRDEVMTLLLAGHETTANALTWTFYLLSEHPAVRAELEAEVDAVLNGRLPTVEDLPQLSYTRMVIEESMRLYPPAYSIGRMAIDDDAIGGYHVPAGSPVFMSSYVTHRHPDFWDEPEAFRPRRFEPQRVQERDRFAYFPFGGGPRLCIGNNFAMMEAQLLLATVVQRYRLHLAPGHPVEMEPLITLRPKYGMVMGIEARR